MSPLRPLAAVALAVAGFLSLAPDARAGFVTVASRAALAGDDYLDWPTPTSGIPLHGSNTLTTFNGMDVVATALSLNPFGNYVGSQYQTLNGFNSIFLKGSGRGGSEHSVRLQFETAVQAFGADLVASAASAGLNQVRVDLYDTNSSLLTSFVLAEGRPSDAHFNGFFGVRSDTANIGEVRFVSLASGADFGGRLPIWNATLEVNRVGLVTSAGQANPVPAPPGAVLFAAGLVGLAAVRRRSLRPAE